MVSKKDYVWPVIKNVLEAIWDIFTQLLLCALVAGGACLILYLLKWWSILVFLAIAGALYVQFEAGVAYTADKEMYMSRINDRLDHLMRLPRYWCNESLEKKQDLYRKSIEEFIKTMDEYEKRYGKDEKYQSRYNDWMGVDKILRDILTAEEEKEC